MFIKSNVEVLILEKQMFVNPNDYSRLLVEQSVI